MMKLNCWEYMRCGREYGGTAAKDGCCPASTHQTAHGVNGGECAGRLCWSVPGTHCEASGQTTCDTCDFFTRVREEEGISLELKEFEHSQAW